MPISATFGSVGDIISLGVLIKDLCKALDQNRGASAEYREIVAELRTLDDVLRQVVSFFRRHEYSDELKDLYVKVCDAANQCRQCILKFFERIKKYESSLDESCSKKFIRDAARKVQWQASQSGGLTKFRSEIFVHCSTLNMLMTTTGLYA